jgi:hypothetical protein
LYDVANDPHCPNILIEDPNLAELKAELSRKLGEWMKSQGDKGAETEAIAHTRKALYRLFGICRSLSVLLLMTE